MTVTLEPVLVLRPFTLDDAPALRAAIDRNREHLRQWLPWLDWSRTIEEARRFIDENMRLNQDREAFTAGIWIDDKLHGAIGLHRFNLRHRNSSIGYWVDRSQSGQGVMTKACKAVVTLGFREFGLHRIEIRCALGNAKSAAIPQRLGFTEEGLLREAEWLYDHWVDLRVFSMLEQDWEA